MQIYLENSVFVCVISLPPGVNEQLLVPEEYLYLVINSFPKPIFVS